MSDRRLSDLLLEHLESKAEGHTVIDVRVGLGYTAARLDDDAVGVAFTFRDEFSGGCSVFGHGRPLAGRPAQELLAYLNSPSTLETAVGLATANALFNRRRPEFLSGDILDILDLKPTDKVGMVGFFSPILPKLQKSVAEVLIFEQQSREAIGGCVPLPPGEASRRLPDCQVALLTATAIINNTIDDLLTAARGCREVVILGASTPLHPTLFSSTPVTLLSGVIVDAPTELLRVVSEGGGMRKFKNLVTKVNVRI